MRVAKKYAGLLFEEAASAEIADKVYVELAALSDAIFLLPDVARAIASPVAKDKIEDLIIKVMVKYKVSKLTSNFVRIVVRLKRLKYLQDMVCEYKKLMDSAGGSKLIDVVSAKKVTKQEQLNLSKLLEPKFGNNISVKYSVDPVLIGGIVVKCDSMILDASVKGALERI